MKIRIVTPWKQDSLFKEKEADYLVRLKRYASIQLDEVKAEKGESRQAIEKEGERILSHIKRGTCLVALTERGKAFDSKQFSNWIEKMGLQGKSDITFVVGSAAGLGREIIKASEMELSLSPMTLPHQLARVVLLEQIYRAFTILKGEPYHK